MPFSVASARAVANFTGNISAAAVVLGIFLTAIPASAQPVQETRGVPVNTPLLTTRYSNAFNGTSAQTNGWFFTWNAPIEWSPAKPIENSGSGRIDSRTAHRQLIRVGDSFVPATSPNEDPAAGRLRLDARGGHAGKAGRYGTVSRYAIANYQVPLPGPYQIGQSFLEVSPYSTDGVEIMVLVNGNRQFTRVFEPGQHGTFDGEIGPLEKNDVIQVAIGPRGDDTGDAFTWNFEIARATPWFDESTRVLNVATFGAAGDGVSDDGPKIRAAIAAAAQSGAPCVVDFDGAKTYRVATFAGNFAVELSRLKNIHLRGNGATLSILAPKQFANIVRAENVTIEGFTIVYDPLPYFQADIVGFDPAAHTVDIRVWTNYAMPKVDDVATTDNSRTWVFGHTFGQYVSHFWIKTIKPIDAARTADRVLRVTAQRQSENIVSNVGTRAAGLIIANPGFGQQGNFVVKIKESSRILFQDVVVRHAPEFIFLAYGNTGPIRFDNVDMRVPPGSLERFVSWRDGFHIKNNRYGPIWENCDFDGWAMQDDLFNLTTMWGLVRSINATNPLLITVSETGVEGSTWKAGDWIAAQRLNGETKGSARINRLTESGGTYRIELDRAIPGLATDDHLYNEQLANRGSIIRRCQTYRGDAGRSSWRQRTPILVEDNRFDDVYLWIHAEAKTEGPVPADMIFRRNYFRGSSDNGEIITAGYESGRRATRNLLFADNTFDRGWVRPSNAREISWYFNNTLTVRNQKRVLNLENAGMVACLGNTINGVAPPNYLNWITRSPTTIPAKDIVFLRPLSLRAVAGNGQVHLTWTPAPRATNYQVLRSKANGDESVIANVGTDTAYLDSVPGDVIYHYRIRADGTDPSQFSQRISVNIP